MRRIAPPCLVALLVAAPLAARASQTDLTVVNLNVLHGIYCPPDNCHTGAQDRSLTADAVTFPAQITIIKDADVTGPTQFNFTASPSPLTNFTLVDDGTAANTKNFTGILTFTTYSVAESVPSGWTVGSIDCVILDSGVGGGSFNEPDSVTVLIDLVEGEHVRCTFHDIAPTPTGARRSPASPATQCWSACAAPV